MGTPILSWQPGGGVPITVTPPEPAPVIPPPGVTLESGVISLIEGQDYIDVIFANQQLTADWTLMELSIGNLIDPTPVNIWPGIVTQKTTVGFRLQLNGVADSGNYFLSWMIMGPIIPSVVATAYSLSGPATGPFGGASLFTVTLIPGSYVTSPVTITPSDGGGGGTFTPATVELNTDTYTASFTYTPASYGTKTISVVNNGGLTDPPSRAFQAIATTYTLSGPSSGAISALSTAFTVALPVGSQVAGTVTITPSDGGAGGIFIPSSVGLTTAAPSTTFTYTPSTYGVRTISTINSGTLTNPTALTYTSVASTYTLSGPSSGDVSVASTPFTVALPSGGVISGIATVTPNDSSGGGTFTPSSMTLTSAAPSTTFTYNPASAGAKTIAVTNNIGLTNPGSLTYTGIAALVHHLLNTLISYWTLDETSTGGASVGRLDSTATANHVSDASSLSFVSSATGKINNGASFNGTNQFLACTDNTSLRVTGSFTFSCWVKLNTLAGDKCVIAKDAVGALTRDYCLMQDTDIFYMAVAGDLANRAICTPTVTTGVWTHIVAWYDSGTSQVYIRTNNGTTVAGPAASAALYQSAANFFIGARQYGPSAGYINAIIDEVGFWKRVLTADEISKLYNGGAGFPYSSFTT